METRNERISCRHYRFQLPREEADELRAADPFPCPVCDPLLARRGVYFNERAGRKVPLFQFSDDD